MSGPVLKRRALALVVLAAAVVLAALAPRLSLRLPKYPESAVIVGGVLLAGVLVVRLAAAEARRKERARLEHARAEAIRMFSAELAWVDTMHEAEAPEVEALRQALVRRHEQLATAPDIDRMVGLQREALAEAARRGWLGAERLVVLEAHLVVLAGRPAPRPPDPAGPIVHVATTAFAALLPLGASQRITTALLAGLVGALFIVVDALGDDRPRR